MIAPCGVRQGYSYKLTLAGNSAREGFELSM